MFFSKLCFSAASAALLMNKANAAGTDNCELLADVTFLFDQSGSIGRNENTNQYDLTLGRDRTKQMRDFVSQVESKLPIGEDETHVAYAEFSTKDSTSLKNNNNFSYDKVQLQSHLNDVTYEAKDNTYLSYTFLGHALRKVDQDLYANARGEGIPKILVVLTDGVSNDFDLNDDVKLLVGPELRQKEYQIFAVAIGDDLMQNRGRESLLALTGSADNILQVSDFDKLSSIVEDLSKRICSVDCGVSEWNEWSACSLENNLCGDGSTNRTRIVTRNIVHKGKACPPLVEEQHCSEPCNCEVSQWSEWSDVCTFKGGDCGDGETIRTRSISKPATHNGTACPALEDHKACSGACHCKMSEWSEWSECKPNTEGTCGNSTGTITRTKTVIQQSSHGGDECPQSLDENPCDIDCPETVQKPAAESSQTNVAAIAGGAAAGVGLLVAGGAAVMYFKRSQHNGVEKSANLHLDDEFTTGRQNPLYAGATTTYSNALVL
eukprot:Pgem_evm1s2088